MPYCNYTIPAGPTPPLYSANPNFPDSAVTLSQLINPGVALSQDHYSTMSMGPGPFPLHNVSVNHGPADHCTKWNARKGKPDKVKDERGKLANCDNVTMRGRRF